MSFLNSGNIKSKENNCSFKQEESLKILDPLSTPDCCQEKVYRAWLERYALLGTFTRIQLVKRYTFPSVLLKKQSLHFLSEYLASEECGRESSEIFYLIKRVRKLKQGPSCVGEQEYPVSFKILLAGLRIKTRQIHRRKSNWVVYVWGVHADVEIPKAVRHSEVCMSSQAKKKGVEVWDFKRKKCTS